MGESEFSLRRTSRLKRTNRRTDLRGLGIQRVLYELLHCPGNVKYNLSGADALHGSGVDGLDAHAGQAEFELELGGDFKGDVKEGTDY